MSQSKTSTGNFFEDFRVGQEIRHATPRTLTEADAALNIGLYGSRFAINSSDVFARALGLPRAPLDDLLVFHVVIGKTVPDISLNAVANLGYAEFRWGVPVYPGDTLSAHSTVLGLRENSNRASGVVWVRSTGTNQQRRDGARLCALGDGAQARSCTPAVGAPVGAEDAPASVAPADLIVPAGLDADAATTTIAAGSPHRWEDYAAGRAHRPCERHHRSRTPTTCSRRGSTRTPRGCISTPCRQEHALRPPARPMAAMSSRSPARCRSTAWPTASGSRRSMPAATSAPTFGGDTIYAWSEVLEKAPLPGRGDIGALRVQHHRRQGLPLRLVAGQGQADGKYHPAVVLDLDYWLLVPRR
mgnify:CR=1 FL=1